MTSAFDHAGSNLQSRSTLDHSASHSREKHNTMPAAPATADSTCPPPPPFRRIAVFCGSSAGTLPEYRQAAVDLGTEMAERGIGLVYGGGKKERERGKN